MTINKTYICSAANTIIPSIHCMEKLGYNISKVDLEDEEEWTAESKHSKLVAEDPLTLLGLVKLFEERGSSWRLEENDFDELMKKFYPNL